MMMMMMKLFLRREFKSDFDETWYEWYEGKGYVLTERILNICINYAN